MDDVRQNLTIKGYHECHIRSQKDLEMLIMATAIFLLTRLILQ